MSRVLLSILFISVVINCRAQKIERQSIVPVAFVHPRLEYTIGEIVVGQHINGRNIMSYSSPVSDVVQGIEPNTLLGGVSIYPNPTTEELNIESVSDITGYVIIDMMGKIIFDRSNDAIRGALLRISTSEVPAGTYLLRVSFSTGKTSKIMFIKAR